jgi:hypothetical protein
MEVVVRELPGTRRGNQENREDPQEDPDDLLDEDIWLVQEEVMPEFPAGRIQRSYRMSRTGLFRRRYSGWCQSYRTQGREPM